MALIEKFHVVAAEQTVAAGQVIKEGQVVALNTLGQVVLQDTVIATDNQSPYVVPYGIAGDTKSTSASAMPGVASGWQGRASDYYDETRASGKMTVYHSGGEFATDQFATNVAGGSVYPGAALYAKAGVLDTDNASSTIVVARLTKVDGFYPSGVPGTDLNGDLALSGDNNSTYIEFKLTI